MARTLHLVVTGSSNRIVAVSRDLDRAERALAEQKRRVKAARALNAKIPSLDDEEIPFDTIDENNRLRDQQARKDLQEAAGDNEALVRDALMIRDESILKFTFKLRSIVLLDETEDSEIDLLFRLA